MSRIDEIRRVRHGSPSRLIVVDGEPWRCFSVDVIAQLGIVEGDSVDLDDVLARADEIEPRLARDRAIHLLSFRDRSESGLAARLVQDGFSHDAAVAAVDDLVRLGLVDDQRHAEMLARSLVGVKRLGSSGVLRRMIGAGIPEDVASEALCEALDPETELANARRIAESAARKSGATVDKVAAKLVRKGYRTSVALSAARAALSSASDDDGTVADTDPFADDR